MKRKERYIARLDEVTITREEDSAVIGYKEEGIMSTHLKIGPEIKGMSDAAILGLFNDTLRAQAQLAADYNHVSVEVPLGSPQIKYTLLAVINGVLGAECCVAWSRMMKTVPE
jgi:hypothetical protein